MPVGLGQPGAAAGRVERVQVRLVRPDRDRRTPSSSPSSRSSLVVNLACAGPAAADHVDLADLAGRQRVEHRLGDVGVAQLGRVPDQDAGHVHGDVADPDHRDRVGVQGERVRVHVGVAAVPVDEVGGREAAGQVLAGDAEPPVGHRAGGVDHRVVAGGAGRPWSRRCPGATPPRNLTPSCSSTRRRYSAIDLIDLWSGATPYRTRPYGVGSRSSTSTRIGPAGPARRLLDQRLGGVEAGRPGTDDGDLDRVHSLPIVHLSGAAARARVPGCGTATAAVISRARCCGVSPPSSRISARARRASRNSCGRPNVRTGVSTCRVAQQPGHRVAEPAGPPLSSTVTTRRCAAAAADDRLVDRLDPARVHHGHADAVVGEQRRGRGAHARPSTRRRAAARPRRCRAAGRASTSTRPSLPTAGRSVSATLAVEPQHGRPVADRDRLAQQLGHPAASRGAASRRPGTTRRIEQSHMPLWLAPSGPVTPARSSTKVTGSRCMATSISTWSKARFRNVA